MLGVAILFCENVGVLHINYSLILFHRKASKVMEQFLYIALIIVGLVLVSFFLINLRQIFTGQEFRGTCASNNPMVRDKVGECSVCGSKPGEACKQEDLKPASIK
jgi:hypothetical protein